VHNASLIHDDILDDALMRRHQLPVNKKWGNKIAVLFGDYLYTKAFSVIGENEAGFMLMSAACGMCEGEIIQNIRMNDFSMKEHEYIEIISKKSGILFGASCGIGALLGGADARMSRAMDDYGVNIGITYQILDDLKDILGKEEEEGKTFGTDFNQGKMTLPLIFLQDISSNLFEYSKENIAIVADRVYAKARGYSLKAVDSLGALPESVYAQSLKKIADGFRVSGLIHKYSDESDH
jgi:octaprenyl-diphosphate synthase